MDRGAVAYFDLVRQATVETEATDNHPGKVATPITSAVQMIRGNDMVFFIGNGGSLAACSHMANDLCLAGIKALVFDSAVNMACIGNDFGFDNVFSKQAEWLIKSDSLLIALSCSGKSQNILRAVSTAYNAGARTMTFSGFEPDNPLRKVGDLNFWVPSESYGIVQLAHEAILHCIVDNVAGLI